MMRASREGTRIAVCVALLGLAGCATEAEHDDRVHGEPPALVADVYTGWIPGTDVAVAVSIQDGNVISYTCGGDETYATHSRWFCGALTPGTRTFQNEFEGWRFDFEAFDDRLEATLTTPVGEPQSFVLAHAAGTHAGLFGFGAGGCETGVIVLQDEIDGPVQVQGTYCEGASERFEQVTPVRPIEIGFGIQVEVDLPERGRPLYMYTPRVHR